MRPPSPRLTTTGALLGPVLREAEVVCREAGIALDASRVTPLKADVGIELDAGKSRRLLGHLVDSAVAAGKGGRLALDLDVLPAGPGRATVSFEVARLAERDGATRSSGADSELVARLTQALGALVERRLEPGSGTVERALLPARALPVIVDTQDPTDLGGGRALVVEDDRDARAALALLLEDWGFEVVDAGSGLEAVDAIAQSGARVALLDIDLPDHDGFAVRELLRARFPDLPVIFLSGSESHVGSGKDELRTRFLLKPVDLTALEDSLRAVLAPA